MTAYHPETLDFKSVTSWNFYVASLGRLLKMAHMLEKKSKRMFGNYKGKLDPRQSCIYKCSVSNGLI